MPAAVPAAFLAMIAVPEKAMLPSEAGAAPHWMLVLAKMFGVARLSNVMSLLVLALPALNRPLEAVTTTAWARSLQATRAASAQSGARNFRMIGFQMNH